MSKLISLCREIFPTVGPFPLSGPGCREMSSDSWAIPNRRAQVSGNLSDSPAIPKLSGLQKCREQPPTLGLSP